MNSEHTVLRVWRQEFRKESIDVDVSEIGPVLLGWHRVFW